MHRLASTLGYRGMEVMCIGRRFAAGGSVQIENCRVKRMRLLFNKGPFFYACFNLRLFLYLLFAPRPSLLIANDLDTLLASYLASRIRRSALIYDSHEYFTEVPELINRRATRKFWLRLEGFLLRRIRFAITVSEPIARK